MTNIERPNLKLLLVDDHPFVLEGIRSCLVARSDFVVVGEAVNGKEAIDKAKELMPDVIIMDISMPVMNGIEATRHLRKSMPGVKVLILTMHEQQEFGAQIAEAGACGFLSKNSPPAELVRAIEAIQREGTFFSAALTDKASKRIDLGLAQAKGTVEPDLSLREREVLTLVAEGFSNKEAASVLGVSVRTIEKHRERIMHKLNLHSVVGLTKYAIANQMVQVN